MGFRREQPVLPEAMGRKVQLVLRAQPVQPELSEFKGLKVAREFKENKG